MRFTGTWHDEPRFVDGDDCRVVQRRTVLHRESVICHVAGAAEGLQRLRDLDVWTTADTGRCKCGRLRTDSRRALRTDRC